MSTQLPTSIQARITWAGDPEHNNTEYEVSFTGVTGKQLEKLQWLDQRCNPAIRMSLEGGELMAFEHGEDRITEHYIYPNGTMESYVFNLNDHRFDRIETLEELEEELS